MVVDTTPLVGNFLEAFIDISSSSKPPMRYAPIFPDSSHQERFDAFFSMDLVKKFQKGEFKVPSMTRTGMFSNSWSLE